MTSLLPLAENTPANIFSALPSILWFFLALVVLVIVRKPVATALASLAERIRCGAAFKFGELVISGVAVVPQSETRAAVPESESSAVGVNPVERYYEREQYYRDSKNVMLVHRLFRSGKPEQAYDILIYLLPHDEGILTSVKSVDYFFGPYWGNRVFSSEDRSRGFPILTSAYGCFLCTAKLFFNDGSTFILHRYIDFEMGAYAPLVDERS